jgi:hypothetical protein
MLLPSSRESACIRPITEPSETAPRIRTIVLMMLLLTGGVHLSVWQCSIRTQVRATKLDEAADKVNAQAIVAAFTPFLNTKVRQMDAARG